MKFDVGDSVEVLPDRSVGIWVGEVGTVAHIRGPNIYVNLPGVTRPIPFAEYELRHSQQKLPLDETEVEREVRLEEEMNADLIERRNVRGITPPDY